MEHISHWKYDIQILAIIDSWPYDTEEYNFSSFKIHHNL